MIKPTSYWAMHKTCDAYTLGRVGATLGGQTVEPPLTPAEEALVSVVRQDSEWMDERIEAQRERWKDRQRNARKSRDVTVTNGDKRVSRDVTVTSGDNGVSRDVTVTSGDTRVSRDVTLHPSIPPSIHPTLDNTNVLSKSVCINTRARGDVPGLDEVVEAAKSTMGVPEWYARWWYDQMVAYDWTSTKGIRIGNGNWRAMLKAWHNRSQGDPKEYERVRSEYEAKKPKVIKVTPADWCLCIERCAMFEDGRCRIGKIVPPQMRPHQIPPEECDGFKRLETREEGEEA